MGNYCKRCAKYDWRGVGCECAYVGKVWRTEDGEDGAYDLYGLAGDIEFSVNEWAIRKHSDDFEFMSLDETTTFTVKSPDGEFTYVNVLCELTYSYNVNKVDKDDEAVQEARDCWARCLRAQRSRKHVVA